MTIWSLTLVVLAGVSLAAGWRLHLNEPILASIGLSAGALLLLIVSMVRDRSAKRKKSGGQSSSVAGRPESTLHPSAAGYGASAFHPTVPSDGYPGSYPFTGPYPAGPSVKPLHFEHDTGEVPDLERSLSAHENPEMLGEPEATVQILPPETGESPASDGPADPEVVAAETEAFRVEAIEEEASPPPQRRPEETAWEPSESPLDAPHEPGKDVSLNGDGGGDGAPKTPVSEAWGFRYLPSSEEGPEEGFAEPEAPSASEGRSGGPGDDRRGDGRRPLPSKEALSRRKASGKLVYWWETDQGNAGATREHGRAGGSPAPKPKSARPAEGPRDSSQPAPKVSEDVSATPAERAQPPEITIRLVPAPKRRTKPASKRPKAKPAAKAPTSTPQALSKLSSSSAAPPPAIEGEAGTPLPAIIEDAATSAAPATEASRAGVTGKPVPAVRTRPTIATRPATKLRTTAKTTSPGKRGAATGGRPAPQNRPESPAKAEPDPRADSADDSKAPMTSPPEERPFKYLG